MQTSSLQFKLLLLAAAVAVGYLAASAFRALRGPGEPPPAHAAPPALVLSPEELLASSAAGAGIPQEIQSRMLGLTAPPPRLLRRVKQEPRIESPYAFAIGEHLKDQIETMKTERRIDPDLQNQEDGVTQENLDAMAREGRMAW